MKRRHINDLNGRKLVTGEMRPAGLIAIKRMAAEWLLVLPDGQARSDCPSGTPPATDMIPQPNWRQNPWFALALLFGINLINFFDRIILSAVTEPVRREWGLRDTEIGWLGTGFTLVYAAAGVPLGRLADRSSRKWLLAIGVAVWSVLTAVSGLAVGFWTLFLARVGVGIGEATCAPAATGTTPCTDPTARITRTPRSISKWCQASA